MTTACPSPIAIVPNSPCRFSVCILVIAPCRVIPMILCAHPLRLFSLNRVASFCPPFAFGLVHVSVAPILFSEMSSSLLISLNDFLNHGIRSSYLDDLSFLCYFERVVEFVFVVPIAFIYNFWAGVTLGHFEHPLFDVTGNFYPASTPSSPLSFSAFFMLFVVLYPYVTGGAYIEYATFSFSHDFYHGARKILNHRATALCVHMYMSPPSSPGSLPIFTEGEILRMRTNMPMTEPSQAFCFVDFKSACTSSE